jgi:hypothetical protein
MTSKTVVFTVQLTNQQAFALAQFVKRIGWVEIRQNATGDDEADDMRSGLDQLRKGLQEVGYDPR